MDSYDAEEKIAGIKRNHRLAIALMVLAFAGTWVLPFSFDMQSLSGVFVLPVLALLLVMWLLGSSSTSAIQMARSAEQEAKTLRGEKAAAEKNLEARQREIDQLHLQLADVRRDRDEAIERTDEYAQRIEREAQRRTKEVQEKSDLHGAFVYRALDEFVRGFLLMAQRAMDAKTLDFGDPMKKNEWFRELRQVCLQHVFSLISQVEDDFGEDEAHQLFLTFKKEAEPALVRDVVEQRLKDGTLLQGNRQLDVDLVRYAFGRKDPEPIDVEPEKESADTPAEEPEVPAAPPEETAPAEEAATDASAE